MLLCTRLPQEQEQEQEQGARVEFEGHELQAVMRLSAQEAVVIAAKYHPEPCVLPLGATPHCISKIGYCLFDAFAYQMPLDFTMEIVREIAIGKLLEMGGAGLLRLYSLDGVLPGQLVVDCEKIRTHKEWWTECDGIADAAVEAVFMALHREYNFIRYSDQVGVPVLVHKAAANSVEPGLIGLLYVKSNHYKAVLHTPTARNAVMQSYFLGAAPGVTEYKSLIPGVTQCAFV